LYGKAWAKIELKLKERYYSFDSHGWHFIVLDSTHIRPDGKWYTAKLDEEQFKWLQSDLKNLPENAKVLVLSHIPILAASAFLDGDNAQTGDWVVPGAWMHIDAGKIIELFYKHPQVKVCLSGHLHLLDKVVYNNVTYYCNGATSGSWWDDEPYHQTHAGYAIVDLYEDGNSTRQYVEYLNS
jgi:3',5'-cyclic-AMP phosphodiesterase